VDNHLAWLIAGFVLVIAELLSGTFYLLVLGIAAFSGAAAAWAAGGLGVGVQAIVAAAVALAGVVWVHRWRGRTIAERMPSLDAGRPAVFETWTDRAAGRARVRYRDSTWDAIVDDAGDTAPGQVLYIASVEGNTLRLTRTPAAHGNRR
jgi:membrane protein implicated in regulation of membrane protease activity